jgi:serine/threonine protein kinase
MEYISGDSLKDLIDSGRILHIPFHNRLENIIRQVGDALAFAHDRQIVHRDIKPDNVRIIGNGDKAYLLDFSVAVTDIHQTQTGIGTPLYMPPEVLPSKAADIFSFAVVAYEVLFGHHPIFFKDDHVISASRAQDLMMDRLPDAAWRLPSTVGPQQSGFPPDIDWASVDATFMQALAYEKANRPSSAIEFVHALRMALQPVYREPIAGDDDEALQVQPSYTYVGDWNPFEEPANGLDSIGINGHASEPSGPSSISHHDATTDSPDPHNHTTNPGIPPAERAYQGLLIVGFLAIVLMIGGGALLSGILTNGENDSDSPTPPLVQAPSATPTAEDTPTLTAPPTNTSTPVSSATTTASATTSPSRTPSASATNTRTLRPSATGSPTQTPTSTASSTSTMTITPSATHTASPTPSLTATPTWTVTPTQTPTQTPSATVAFTQSTTPLSEDLSDNLTTLAGIMRIRDTDQLYDCPQFNLIYEYIEQRRNEPGPYQTYGEELVGDQSPLTTIYDGFCLDQTAPVPFDDDYEIENDSAINLLSDILKELENGE